MVEEEKEIKIKEWNGDLTLKYLYREYYSLNPPLIIPKDIERREFAFQPFEKQSYVRHLSFDSLKKLYDYLIKNTPRHVYYSIAVYDLPEAGSMEEKGWKGSDFLFDIDLDHEKDCIMKNDITDDSCIEKGLKYAETIGYIINNYFGGTYQIYFTGNRGYHVRGFCELCKQLGREERSEIAKFIMAQDLDIDIIFPKSSKGKKPALPTVKDPGWRGLIANFGIKEVSKEDINNAVQNIRVEIDSMVTQDPSRLTRIPGTLNGKSSLLVLPVCGEFKLGKWVSPFYGEVDVKAKLDLDNIRILGYDVKFNKNEELSLPSQQAIYLATKGYLVITGGKIVVRKNTGWWPIQGCNWNS
jgi:DNA primase small subunit